MTYTERFMKSREVCAALEPTALSRLLFLTAYERREAAPALLFCPHDVHGQTASLPAACNARGLLRLSLHRYQTCFCTLTLLGSYMPNSEGSSLLHETYSIA